jgi:S-DNA-T family DNA segregation ATPase FtsK/SpoIIIE
MRKKNHKAGKEGSDGKTHSAEFAKSRLHPEIRKIIVAIAFFVLAAIFALSYQGYAGRIGGYLFSIFNFLLGAGYIFAPLVSILLAFSLFSTRNIPLVGPQIVGGILLLVSGLGFLRIFSGTGRGGIIGDVIGGSLLTLFETGASILILGGIFAASTLLLLNIPFWKRSREKKNGETKEPVPEAVSGETKEKTELFPPEPVMKRIAEYVAATLSSSHAASVQNSEAAGATNGLGNGESAEENGVFALPGKKKTFPALPAWEKPPLDLLRGDQGKPSSGDIRANANIIKRTLENFNIDVEMGEVSIGPTVTQYTLKPAQGVKLSRITALQNDLSLSLAAHPIRIEAPIPGKSLVGVEVPNRSAALVGLRSLFEHSFFQENPSPLLLALGRDVAGNPVFADLTKMPHLLISGATGSGKSVCMHSLITSFFYRNAPDSLRFIMVDPKRVELSVYNDVAHLLTPVITDPKKTIQALRWATKEMDRRYDMLSERRTRDIASYNADVEKNGEGEKIPYLVIVIDELADLMAVFPREVENSIIRLAQMARAVGIHLIVATQRPSVDVITGLIKANITSRIAFQVASQVDSRTVLDMAGAEKLLGNGDMLFLAGDTAKPRRIQGAFVSEQEVKRVVAFLCEEGGRPEYEDALIRSAAGDAALDDHVPEGDDDPLYEDARELVVQAGKASTSYLQRRLRVGYARAARLIDLLEERNVIGPGEGAKPRDVLIKTADIRFEEEKDGF